MAPTHERRFDDMKRYVRFDEGDSAALARVADGASAHLRGVAERFYERTREHADAHAVFVNEAQIERLKSSLVRWMERLFRGPHDEAYYEERRKIGRVHVQIGLPERYMFTAMSVVRSDLGRVLARVCPDADALAATRDALDKLLDLELAVMLETYGEALRERVRRTEEARREGLSRALERSEQRYARALELAPVLAVAVDAAGRVVLFNRAAEAATGYARDEVEGEDFFDTLVPELTRDDERARVGAWLATEQRGAADAPEGAPWELELRTRAGRVRSVRFRAARLDGVDPTLLFALGEDVTEARELASRTLRNERLAAVGTLAAGLAHEIRNPLNGAQLHLTYLARALDRGQGSSAEAREAVDTVSDQIKRLGTLVRDFLVFARPNPPRLAAAPLGPVVRRVASLVEAEARAASVSVELDVPDGVALLPLMIDAQKIEQVLLNLARNAVEAVASTGGGRVWARLRRRPRHVVCEVEDEGPGLPPNEAPVFDAFFTTKQNGTGLGLAIVQRIVTDHDGVVEVDSHPGCTVFRVVLPLSPDEGARVEREAEGER